jgi:predicted nucleic acid-binding protein
VRVFFDTNVLVSAFLARGLCADLLRLVLTEHTLVTSEVVLAELRDVLSRKGRLPAQQIEAIEMFLREHPVGPTPVQTLELGQADLFVTGDQGVLACSKPPCRWLTRGPAGSSCAALVDLRLIGCRADICPQG